MQARPETVSAPGRVNLIGEHIDYHGGAVLPIALRRRIHVTYRARPDRRIRARSEGYGAREFEWTPGLVPVAAGDWENYLRAAAQAVAAKWGAAAGVDAGIVSDLPPAAGLSSSSALLVAFTLALLRANGREASFAELMEVLPDAEQFVGTRGGGMDHAASLASRAGCASLIEFDPLSVRHIPVPEGWSFLVANSGENAEKSGAVRELYNARRRAGTAALERLGLRSYRDAAVGLGANLPPEERDAFEHVTTEFRRVRQAVEAWSHADALLFGRLLLDSHASLRDRLRVSTPALDRLVEAAMDAGALGARLTGAGFGGCAVIFCRTQDLARVRSALSPSYELIDAQPGPGALCLEKS